MIVGLSYELRNAIILISAALIPIIYERLRDFYTRRKRTPVNDRQFKVPERRTMQMRCPFRWAKYISAFAKWALWLLLVVGVFSFYFSLSQFNESLNVLIDTVDENTSRIQFIEYKLAQFTPND